MIIKFICNILRNDYEYYLIKKGMETYEKYFKCISYAEFSGIIRSILPATFHPALKCFSYIITIIGTCVH